LQERHIELLEQVAHSEGQAKENIYSFEIHQKLSIPWQMPPDK